MDKVDPDRIEMVLPTQENIDAAISIYTKVESWQQANRTISSYFGQCPSNSDELAVIIKVVLVNSLYNTNIQAPLLMANHILNLQNLDQQLQAGAIHAVDKIANCVTIGRNLVSFASKYAHFSNMAAFPMYDKYVRISMARFRKIKSYQVDSYEDFFGHIDFVRTLARLTNVSWADLDKYLWLYGQKVAMSEGKDNINQDVAKLHDTPEGRALFEDLEPVECFIVL